MADTKLQNRVQLLRQAVERAEADLRKAHADIPSHPMRDKCFDAMQRVSRGLNEAIATDNGLRD